MCSPQKKLVTTAVDRSNILELFARNLFDILVVLAVEDVLIFEVSLVMPFMLLLTLLTAHLLAIIASKDYFLILVDQTV